MFRAITGVFPLEDAFEKAVFLFVSAALFSLAALGDLGFCRLTGSIAFQSRSREQDCKQKE